MTKLMTQGFSNTSGKLGLWIPKPPSFSETVKLGIPHKGLSEQVRAWRTDNFSNLLRGLKSVALAKIFKIPTHFGVLYLSKQHPLIPDYILKELLQEYVDQYVPGISFPYWVSQKGFKHETVFLGLASFRVVTTAGVGFIVDAFQNSVELENLKYHGIGTGSTAEAVGDTALVTELTTEYTGNIRATGSTTEGASANIYRTVGTNTLDEAPGGALREHGIFDQAATGGGVLLDRTVYAAITLSSGDSLQSTYDHTQTAGS